MECVIDTSSVSWMHRLGRLELLTQVYSGMYAPPAVYAELAGHGGARDFVASHIRPLSFGSKANLRRFHRLVRRWGKKVELPDIADIQVFVGYRFFSEANEAVYANKNAEEKLSPFGKVRDIARLYELAEAQGLFSREDSVRYLEQFLQLERPYRGPYIQVLLRNLR